ncbi:MAG: hypothetical protein D6759_19005 [Chloroflexi bacterium]|nr:MAG: hypothetical protein D6759_19005 [Chloroflexota bacterium]
MIGLPYRLVRWLILAIGALIIVALLVLRPQDGALVGLVLLLILTGLSAIYPPGLYAWLVHGTCPQCGGRVSWRVDQLPEPYEEHISVRCTRCDWKRAEFDWVPPGKSPTTPGTHH